MDAKFKCSKFKKKNVKFQVTIERKLKKKLGTQISETFIFYFIEKI